jgi:hypothetical protein
VRTGSSLSLEEDDDNDGDDDDDELVTVLPLAEEEESSLLLATLRRLMPGSSRSLSLALDDVEDDDDDEEEEGRLSLLLGSRSLAGLRLTVAVNCGSSLHIAGDGSFDNSPPSGVVLRHLVSLLSLSSLVLPPPPLLASRTSLLLHRLCILSNDKLTLRSSDDLLHLTGLPPLEQHQHTKVHDNGAADGWRKLLFLSLSLMVLSCTVTIQAWNLSCLRQRT